MEILDGPNPQRAGTTGNSGVLVNSTKLFIFGGKGKGGCVSYAPNRVVYFNHIWMFDFNTNKLHFVKGETNVTENISGHLCTAPVVGLGPEQDMIGGRYLFTMFVINDNEIYIFGGGGCGTDGNHGYLSDFWKYIPETNQMFELLPTKRIANLLSPFITTNDWQWTHSPGSRMLHCGTSMRTLVGDDIIVFFGGIGYSISDGIFGYLNDIWLYRSHDDAWKFESGNLDEIYLFPKYLKHNEYSSLNDIGGRISSVLIPISPTVLMIFGGTIVPTSKTSDIWLYDLELGQFNYKFRVNSSNDNYYNRLNELRYIHPSPRQKVACDIDVKNNVIYMFGGIGNYLSDDKIFSYGYFGDIWKFDIPSFSFKLLDDCEVNKITSAKDNELGARRNSIMFIRNDKLVLYGGEEDGILNYADVWEFKIPNEYDNLLYIIIISSSIVGVFIFISLLFIFIVIGIFTMWLILQRKGKKVEKESDFSKIQSMNEVNKQNEKELFDMIFSKRVDEKYSKFQKNLFENNESLKNLCKRIEYNRIKFISYKGSGGSGANVFQIQLLNDETQMNYAFKSYPLKFGDELLEFQKELTIFLKLNHPNILKCHGMVLQPKHFGLILTYCEQGDLSHWMKLNDVSIQNKVRILYGIAKGMNALHLNSIVHRDLKLQNVLMKENIPKIMDFGLSRLLSRTLSVKTIKIGTSNYQAPEIINGTGKYSRKVDIFSFSILCFIFLTKNREPFGKEDKYGDNMSIRIANDENFRPNLLEIKGDSDFDWLRKMIAKCWDANPKARYHFYEICNIFQTKIVVKIDSEKKEEFLPPPITIYVKKKDSNEEAEDFEMKKFEMSELYEIAKKKWNMKEESVRCFRDNEIEIKENNDLLKLTDDSIIEYEFNS